MDRLRTFLASPGRRQAIVVAAPTAHAELDVPRVSREDTDLTVGNDVAIDDKRLNDDDKAHADLPNLLSTSLPVVKTRLDRWLDAVVRFSGHPLVFGLLVALLLAWAFCGISYSDDLNWQVAISDVQALLCLVFDSFLMRQQLRAADLNLRFVARLRSRDASKLRMLRAIARRGPMTSALSTASMPERTVLVKQSLFGRMCAYLSLVTGHFTTLLTFWVGIICWLAFGPSYDWSPQWQLYINSATSAMMVFVFAFLSCVRERHAEHVQACMVQIEQEDIEIEHLLRKVTGDTEPNPSVVIAPPKLSKVQRGIYYYADLVGTLAGIAVLGLVLIVWVAIGPTCGWSTNWFLISGTYAGLVGLNDGFVLDNIDVHLQGVQKAEFDLLRLDDQELQAIFSGSSTESDIKQQQQQSTWKRIMHAFSSTMTSFCAHEYVPIAGVVFIIGLVAAASAMQWDLTGQLLCNIPPSIIETWWMMLLMNGHTEADQTARIEMTDLLQNRKWIHCAVQEVTA